MFLQAFFNSLLWNNYIFIEVCKEMYKGILGTLPSASSNVNILQNYSTASKSKNWHWYNLESLFKCHPLLMWVYVCVCVHVCASVCPYAVFSSVELWMVITTIKIFNCTHHHKTPFCHHFIATPIFSLPSLTLIPGNQYSILHLYYYVVPQILNKWNHPARILLRLVFLFSIISLRFLQDVLCINSCFLFWGIFFHCWVVFHGVDTPRFV